MISTEHEDIIAAINGLQVDEKVNLHIDNLLAILTLTSLLLVLKSHHVVKIL
jgi:hypothetical protein